MKPPIVLCSIPSMIFGKTQPKYLGLSGWQLKRALVYKCFWSRVWHHEALCIGAATQYYKQQPTEQCNPSSSHSTVVINITKNLQRSMSLLLSSMACLLKLLFPTFLFWSYIYFVFLWYICFCGFSTKSQRYQKAQQSSRQISQKTCNGSFSYYLAPWPAC